MIECKLSPMGKNITEPFSREMYCILGLPFDAVNLEQAISIVNDGVDNSAPCFLSTPNLNFIMSAQSDDAFFQSVINSDLSIADGMPIIWIAQLLGIPLKERLAGSTLFNALSTTTKEKKINVFFFGGQAGVAELAHDRLNASSLGMTCCGFHDPGFVSIDEMSSAEIIDSINQAEPDFVVVALGAKKGQEWIQNNRSALEASVISHLGAVINFVAGGVERAPEFWQKYGLEWLWRIKQEPALWRRYFFDGLGFSKLLLMNVLPLFFYTQRAKRASYYHAEAVIEMCHEQDNDSLKLSGSFTAMTLAELKLQLPTLLNDYNQDLVIDCSKLEYIDSAFMATLLLFQVELNKRERSLSLTRTSPRIKRLLKLNAIANRLSIVDC